MKLFQACILSLIAAAAAAQPAPAADMSEQAMNQWISSARPVAEHDRLRAMTGRWKVRQRDWRGGAAPWNDAQGTATWRPVLGGRFMEQELVTSLKDHPYHGMELVGFDRDSGKYVGAWMDDFGTSLLPLEGNWDEKTRSLTLKGYIGPQADPRMQWMMKQTWADKDHMTVEWWGPTAAGTTVKVVEVDYSRLAA
ncbi:MAG TPA: DUF1579 family protein [Sphingomicrobium sp.]|nr:DUF1579 family protein [Sphingomicrobium sp.]